MPRLNTRGKSMHVGAFGLAWHASPISMAIAQGPSACTLDEIVNASSVNTLSREKLLLMAANNVLPVSILVGAHARIRLHGHQMLAPRHTRSLSAASFRSSQSPTPFNRLQSIHQFSSVQFVYSLNQSVDSFASSLASQGALRRLALSTN
ncbi:uncharacterized protein TrAtP1_000924 [Trichoderma atroviride]|uniref:uncharacterized protein n=1 Tax=Hypocrea atroviridis TaxID=63577 RepID=UPI0033252439|nr:hypothetical protein TrAtP1_000924 [Trichoderma atroviride]